MDHKTADRMQHWYRNGGKEQHRKWLSENKGKTADYKRKMKFGMPYGAYEKMYAEQHGRCLICDRHRNRMAVDHNHATGAVRGLLCHTCNFALGLMHDDSALLRKAAAYLRTHCVGNLNSTNLGAPNSSLSSARH